MHIGSPKNAASSVAGPLQTMPAVARCISSHDLQLAKENAGFWLRLKEEQHLDFDRCLFLDDSLNVLRRARDEGVKNALQVLQPDTTLPPRAPSEFPGILHFNELMRA